MTSTANWAVYMNFTIIIHENITVFQSLTFSSVSGIGISDGISVSYLRSINLKFLLFFEYILYRDKI